MEIEEQFLEVSQLIQKTRFNETCQGHEKVSAMMTQISWIKHLLIFSENKTIDEIIRPGTRIAKVQYYDLK
jgi:hypothetical protein